MADAPGRAGGAARPRLYTIPAHRAFADALVAGLMRARDTHDLARGMVLLPNNRAVRAITDAFVRASGGGLILPRLVPLGDPDLGEAVGASLDPVDDEAPPPPAVAPYARRMILARLVGEERARAGHPVSGAEAVRLSGDFHVLLAELSGSSILARLMRELTPLTCLAILTFEAPTAVACPNDEHAWLIDAIERGDTDGAARLMTEHLTHIESALKLDAQEVGEVDLAEVLFG